QRCAAKRPRWIDDLVLESSAEDGPGGRGGISGVELERGLERLGVRPQLADQYLPEEHARAHAERLVSVASGGASSRPSSACRSKNARVERRKISPRRS